MQGSEDKRESVTMKEEALVGARLGSALGASEHGFRHSSVSGGTGNTCKLLITVYYGFSIPVSSSLCDLCIVMPTL